MKRSQRIEDRGRRVGALVLSLFVDDHWMQSFLFTTHNCVRVFQSVQMCVCVGVREPWFNATWHPQHQWRSIYLLFWQGLPALRSGSAVTWHLRGSPARAPAHVTQTTETAPAPWQQNAKYCHGQMWVARCQHGGFEIVRERESEAAFVGKGKKKSLFHSIRGESTWSETIRRARGGEGRIQQKRSVRESSSLRSWSIPLSSFVRRR